MQPHPPLTAYYGTSDEKRDFVQVLFDQGAPFYDRVVGWGFLGTGVTYRRMAQRRAGLERGLKLLDAAAGTGLMAEAAIKAGVAPADIVCLDPSSGMLAVAREKLQVEIIQATADAIPLEDASFDFVTMGYALRHVADLEATFREYARVLRPGGRVLILEVTKPENRCGAWLFRLWFRNLYPALARLFTGSEDARRMMRYYWETMDTVVPPATILDALRAAGFIRVRRRVVGAIFSEYFAAKSMPRSRAQGT